MPENFADEPMPVGLRPRLLAAIWFALTACIPIVLFFWTFGSAALLEPGVASVFGALPIFLAAFFGFTIGARILDQQCVMQGYRAVLLGMLIATASYVGMMTVYAVFVIF